VKGKLTEDKLMRALKVGEDSPLYHFAKEMAEVLLGAEEFSKPEYMKNRYYDDESDLDPIEKKIFDKGFTLYSGSAADDGYGSSGAETALCELDLDYEDEELIIFKESGY